MYVFEDSIICAYIVGVLHVTIVYWYNNKKL